MTITEIMKHSQFSRDYGRKISSLLLTPPSLRQKRPLPTNLAGKILDQMVSPGILLLDDELNVVYSNSAMRTLVNQNSVSENWCKALHPADQRSLLRCLKATVQKNSAFTTECRVSMMHTQSMRMRWLSCDAQPFCSTDMGFNGCLCTFTDITDQRQTNENLVQLSLYDPLTKLPNRNLLMGKLKHALTPGNITDLALVYVDLDGFKLINDTLGREHGNQLIREVGQRINSCLESTDLLGRHQSDEFTAIVQHHDAPQRATAIAKQIIQAVEHPFCLAQEQIYITASVGIAVSRPGISAEGLLQQADVAMYKAKARKGNAVQHHCHEQTAQNRAKLLVGRNLHRALENNEFKVFYQPQLDIVTNKICGSEALLRWNNPELGSITPSIFIPMLEDRGLIIQVGEWVLRQACHAQSRWHQQYPNTNTTVAVNVSSLQLHDRHFLTKLKQILDESKLHPNALTLEITETILLDEFVSECRLLHEISALGVKIALDDFGTGYGSFSYLKKHPIDHIKIDRSFVDNLFECEQNKAITTSIIALSHKLGKKVIAEGVSSEDELNFLMLKGCDIYQGFFSSGAIPAVEFECQFLAEARLPEVPCNSL